MKTILVLLAMVLGLLLKEVTHICTVAGKTCNSPSKFENLVRPYMEE